MADFYSDFLWQIILVSAPQQVLGLFKYYYGIRLVRFKMQRIDFIRYYRTTLASGVANILLALVVIFANLNDEYL